MSFEVRCEECGAPYLLLLRNHPVKERLERGLEVFDPLLLKPRNLGLDKPRTVVEFLLGVQCTALRLEEGSTN